MNFASLSALVGRVYAWADGVQQRHSVFGFPYAVIKKYGDDDGGREAALITYYGFLSIFPLLLLGVAILSRVLASNPDLRQKLISATVPEALQSTVEHSAATLPTSTVPFIAGLIGRAVGWYAEGQSAGFIASVIGAIVLLAIYRLIVGRRGGGGQIRRAA